MKKRRASKFLELLPGLVLFGASLTGPAQAQPDGPAIYSFSKFSTQSSEIHLFAIDPVDGSNAAVVATDSSSYPWFAAFSGPSGELYVLGQDNVLSTVDPSDGSVLPIATIQVQGPLGMAFAPDGSLRITTGSELHRVDTSTGQVLDTLVLDYPVRALGGNGHRLVGVGHLGVGLWSLEEIDPSDGSLTLLSMIADEGCPFDADLDAQGNFWLVRNHCPGQLFIWKSVSRIADLESGQETSVGSWGPGSYELGFAALAVWNPRGVVEVPVLDRLGIVSLILALMLVGLWFLTRL